MEIVWDERKRQVNLDKHEMDFADLDQAFLATSVALSGKGSRLLAINILNDIPTTVVFARLGSEAISIISMRPASARERRLL